MRLSVAANRILDAIAEKSPDNAMQAEFLRNFVKGAIVQYGDLELNIEIKVVPPGASPAPRPAGGGDEEE